MASSIDRHRRELLLAALRLGAAGVLSGAFGIGAALAAPQRRGVVERPYFRYSPFQLGIASGEPSADGFVLWTRLAPEPLAPHGGMTLQPVAVEWEVAADPQFRQIVQRGQAVAPPELAHAVHVEVEGLQPDRPYWYRFIAGRERSIAGRARTLPAAGAAVDRVRFAVAGCQHYEEGLYGAWRRIAEEPLDFVFHYGDYIYEYGDSGDGTRLLNGKPFNSVRRHIGEEIYSLDDYRLRYALYKSDPDLQAAHAAAPWFVSFDDHEIDNNWAADIDQDGTPPEVFLLRRAAAMQAYYEHMPLRRRSLPVAGRMRMHRRADWGDLLRLHLLDTRQYRSDQAGRRGAEPLSADMAAANRTMLGAEQEAWLFDGLANADTRWNAIAQQVMLMNLDQRADPGQAEPLYSTDQWGGYPHARERLLRHLRGRDLRNVVVVSGDAHRHFAGDVLLDGDERAPVASEFLATSITSGGDGNGEDDDFHRALRRNNPGLKAMTDRRGYVLCDVGREVWRAELKVLDTVATREGTLSTHASFAVERGEPGLKAG